MKKTIRPSAGIGLLVTALAVGPVQAGKNVSPAPSPVVPVAPLGLYVGAGLVANLFSRDCPCGDGSRIHDNDYGGVFRLGYNWSRYLGFEGRLIYAPWEKDFMDFLYGGLYLKPQMEVGDHVVFYGLLGYGRNHLSCDCPGHPHHTHDVWAPAAGVGAEYFFDGTRYDGKRQGWSIWADVVNTMYDKGSDNFRNNVVSAGVNYHF
ncbi:outer membrane beta-barrel protein [Nitratifractor sp.]